MAEPEGKTRVRLDIPDAEHEELRVLAARSGMSMAAYCGQLVREAVRKQRVLKPEKEKK
jgi:hypothetical protein